MVLIKQIDTFHCFTIENALHFFLEKEDRKSVKSPRWLYERLLGEIFQSSLVFIETDMKIEHGCNVLQHNKSQVSKNYFEELCLTEIRQYTSCCLILLFVPSWKLLLTGVNYILYDIKEQSTDTSCMVNSLRPIQFGWSVWVSMVQIFNLAMPYLVDAVSNRGAATKVY
ncbi:hypothetical protein A0J61_07200 [Choanephora cucurbitarum]|uniref:Uncharacterized protein n=1 Tax=Choanephora cucurbitarum TaxID=101091 RepID=A0A1C7N6J4_9FUNG|nr:hypothetical protein A0J61_07200 [Choanephora cucurbitarum]